jgi:hypothetical protein
VLNIENKVITVSKENTISVQGSKMSKITAKTT